MDERLTAFDWALTQCGTIQLAKHLGIPRAAVHSFQQAAFARLAQAGAVTGNVVQLLPTEPKAPRKGVRCSLPESWEPKPAHQTLARELGVDHDKEVAQFRDGAVANGRIYSDWDAAFRTWLRNAQKYGARYPRSTGPGVAKVTSVNDHMQRAERLLAAEAIERAAKLRGGK